MVRRKTEKSKEYEFIIPTEDVVWREVFDRFEIVKTKRGMLFKTYTGYSVFVTRYAVGVDGEAHDTSLYGWLEEAVALHRMYRGHEDEPLSDGAAETKGDLLSAVRITTEANLLYPYTVFTDRDLAMRKAGEYMEWLGRKMKELDDSMSAPSQEEDMAENAKFEARFAVSDMVGEMAAQALELDKKTDDE